MTTDQIPDIIVSRLPLYLQVLSRMSEEGVQTTSSKDLGARLGISAAQIRKDLSQFGEFGKQGTGYSVSFLVDQIQTILKVKQVWDIVLVGAGNLGRAIAGYQGFANRGFRIVMVFDVNPDLIGKPIGEFFVKDISTIVETVRQNGIKMAMITVPASYAQNVAEKLVKAGIEAILSYAPVPLNLPGHVHVEYIDPILQLQHMTYYLAK